MGSNKKFDIWEFLASIKLAVILLIVLAVTSIAGTIIPQNASYEEYLHNYGEVFTRIIDVLELYDMYHSWWFVFLLALFTLNLIVCSIKRLKPLLKQIKNPKKTLDAELEKSISLIDVIKKRGNIDIWKEEIKKILNPKYGKPYEEIGQDIYIYYDKGKYSRLGVYITHLSILFILVGGMIGAIWGFRGFINLPEGSSTNQVFLRGGKEPYKMDFFIRCDDFSLGYYPNGMVKEYRSDVTIIENGKEVKKFAMRVNHPLSYKNLTFYQSSYGVIDRIAKMRVFIKSGKNAGKSYEIEVTEKPINIPFSGDFVRVFDHYPNLENYGPAVILEVSEAGRMPVRFPVYKNLPEADLNPNSNYFFKYIDYHESYYTGLQVTKDPGVWIVWLGCFIMMVGLYYSFFVIRKRIWVRLSFDGERSVITIAGQSSRTRIFEEEFAKIVQQIKDMKI
ncbi:MAG: cytochrome c biogenesis protein ResB [Proteobacteria bacterium]|nr:cytochrome c biogenesis protein ResB [Pseudomonadota bacterium]